MRYGSVCSGIEAASVAWHPLGWRAAFLSEIEAFPRAVLFHHYPETPLHGDFTTIGADDYGPIDLLVGGTPCQSFSVAGLRGGLADKRGNLALEYLRLADRKKPRWVLWENVPGVLSSGDGRDFGSFLGGLGELGYGFAYRVLDAQYFGLAQRRKRVFVVGYLGDWRRAAAVLFEPASLRGDSAPRRETGERVAPCLEAGASRTGGNRQPGTTVDTADSLIVATALRARDGARGVDSDCTDTLIPTSFNNTGAGWWNDATTAATVRKGDDSGGGGARESTLVAYGGNNTAGPIDIATAVNAHGGPHGRLDFESETFVTHALRREGHDASEDGTGRGTPLVPVGYRTSGNCGAWETENRVDALTTGTDRTSSVIGFQSSQSGVRFGDTHATLDANNGSRRHNGAVTGSGVRRLTPRECERLQGFPDGWTDIPYRGKQAADGPRYKSLGNSMAVPVMRWIGKRIAQLDAAP